MGIRASGAFFDVDGALYQVARSTLNVAANLSINRSGVSIKEAALFYENMKPAIFIDTSYLLALLNSRDKYHQTAKNLAEQMTPPFVTSNAVLFELGKALAKPPHR